MTDTEANEARQTPIKDDLHESILDFAAYVLTAARALGKEPASYGPMRLVDTLTRTVRLLEDAGIRDASLEEALTVVRDNRWQVTSNPEAFGEALDDAIAKLVQVTLKDAEV